jgi:hypothetical protein
VSKPAVRPTQPSLQGVLEALTLGIKQLGCESDHSLPSGAEVKNSWHCTSTPPYVFMAWWLVKHRDNFTYICLLFICRGYTVSNKMRGILNIVCDKCERTRKEVFVAYSEVLFQHLPGRTDENHKRSQDR